MNSPRKNRPADRRGPGLVRPYFFFIAPLEVVAVSAIVVGVFAAVSQPFGWQSAVQILVYASLGTLLWWVDDKLDLDDESIVEKVPVAVARQRDHT